MQSSWLTLPLELQLVIASAIKERLDRAALLLTLLSFRSLLDLKVFTEHDILLRIAMHFHVGGSITEGLLRWYARHKKFSDEGVQWLNKLCGKTVAHPIFSFRYRGMEVPGFGSNKILYLVGLTGEAILIRRRIDNGDVIHYEGEKGNERMVRIDYFDCTVKHYEGEKGSERQLLSEFINNFW